MRKPAKNRRAAMAWRDVRFQVPTLVKRILGFANTGSYVDGDRTLAIDTSAACRLQYDYLHARLAALIVNKESAELEELDCPAFYRLFDYYAARRGLWLQNILNEAGTVRRASAQESDLADCQSIGEACALALQAIRSLRYHRGRRTLSLLDRLRVCELPACSGWFIAVDERQTFCSQVCRMKDVEARRPARQRTENKLARYNRAERRS